jgi:hypothetical protein
MITREALVRIVLRAAELQAHDQNVGDGLAREGLTREEVLALGKEVGIPARYFQQALIEEASRTDRELERGILAWLVGPAALAAARVVPGGRASIERALGTWLEQEELLQVKRRYPDHTTWEPKGGAFASLQRALGAGGKKFSLARAAEIAGSAMPLETGFCHLQLRADIRPVSRQRLVGAMMLLGLGASITALAPVLGALFPWTLLPGALLALAALAYGRGHRRDNERIQVGLEQLLDRLERGEIQQAPRLAGPGAGALGRIAAELRGFINP